MRDHRSVPLAVLRDFVIAQAEVTSIRQVASETGIGRTTLHSFVNGETTPHPRVRRKLGLWYLQKVDEAPDMDVVRPYLAVLSTLTFDFAPEDREAGQREVIGGLIQAYDARMERPRWVELLAGIAGIPRPTPPEQ